MWLAHIKLRKVEQRSDLGTAQSIQRDEVAQATIGGALHLLALACVEVAHVCSACSKNTGCSWPVWMAV